MNKRGQEYVQSETVEYLLVVAIGITMALMLFTSLKLEKYNNIMAEDMALTLDSVFIPKGDVSLGYDMGSVERNIAFENGIVKTYIDDAIREENGFILVDENYNFKTKNQKTKNMNIVKEGNKVEVT